MKKDLIIACPTCKVSQRWSECTEHKPFCSKRCQLIDLGEWANESHTIAGPTLYESFDDENGDL
ncbi:MAG: DNA gyrase inhibitor YacG [Gammaproteobacteria bacterium]|nr:MAG: DNA gyrase inhibitor YacG [Gammaproteobacteria bacterium]